jgi:hypothetical protein
VLSLTPLRVLFPHSRLVNALNRHPRMVGVSACIYGILHVTCHILYEGSWDGLLRSFAKPFISFGLAGLMILVITKSLSVLAIGGILTGTAFAGPNDAYTGPVAGRTPINPNYVTIALFRTGVTSAGAKAKAEKTGIPSANPKMRGVVAVDFK